MADVFDVKKEILKVTELQASRVIAYLLEHIRFLEEKVAALSKDSSTSSKPQPSNIVKPRTNSDSRVNARLDT